MADAAIDGNQMGVDDITDFLTVNLASTDYVGHNFGPNSIEVEDTYLRLDRDLADFFNNLDKKSWKRKLPCIPFCGSWCCTFCGLYAST